MGHPLLAQLQQNAAFRAGFVVVAMLAVVGVAWGALPISCLAGACKTSTAPDATLLLTEPVKTPEPAAPTPATPAPEPKPMQVAEAKDPTLTENDVVAATFATLKVDLKPPSQAIRAPQVVASISSDLPVAGGDGEGALKTRVVKTITVNPDGTPVTDAQVQVATVAQPSTEPIPASSADDRVTLLAYASTAGPALDGLPVVAALDEVASAPVPAAAPKKPVIAASVDTAVVSTGANVRSSPSKGKSKVVFTLAAGEKVTVRDKQRGWMKITDDRGRSGWIYQDFLKG
jgi:hypothetical protein